MSEFERQEVMNKLREKCLKKSCGALKQLGCVFRRMDDDYSKKICFEELRQGLDTYGVEVSAEELRILFDAFDKDKNEAIDFNEFMMALRPDMSTSRINVINEAFDKLDANGDGVLKVDDLKGRGFVCFGFSPRLEQDKDFSQKIPTDARTVTSLRRYLPTPVPLVYRKNVQKHPKFQSGQWTEEQTLRYFLDSLDTPGSVDGMVTREEFHNYYAGVSATVDDDCYFDLMMRSCYGLYN